MEPWIYPILQKCSKRLILAGDPKQLPATILTENERVRKQLQVSLLEDLIDRFPEKVHILKTQYRMNAVISKFVSDTTYKGELQAHPSVANHLLHSLLRSHIKQMSSDEKLISNSLLLNPFIFIDTVGKCPEERDSGMN